MRNRENFHSAPFTGAKKSSTTRSMFSPDPMNQKTAAGGRHEENKSLQLIESSNGNHIESTLPSVVSEASVNFYMHRNDTT